ncbi:MAG: hypothetical protein KF685_11000 [Acidobacteria bacterium]|nr:hypothetical protein [Acidobacteriota bacterium]
MKNSIYRISLSLFVMIALLSPASALAAGEGKKNFKRGLKHEAAEEWDKAVEAYLIAVNDNPKNPEYQLHLRRALFNASQMYVRKGKAAAEEKDYEGAYIAFRRAYAYDPVNQLARSEMDRMLRLQKEAKGETDTSDVNFIPAGDKAAPDGFKIPQKLEKLRDVPFPSGVNLMFIIKELAKDLDLNVLFDAGQGARPIDARTVKIELRNVTAAKALDYIFLQEGLFFQRVGPRTILVADTQRRPLLQQLVLKTFFLANASPADIKTVIQTAIPAQQGRAQTIVLEDKATNSITVRDTTENVELIGKLIQSLDKDRAEVVMDVAIYEVNKNDLLQFGNQIGTGGENGTLLNLGGVGLPFGRRGSTEPITSGMGFPNIDIASIALGLPISTFAALQSKNNTKLLASTQIHAFNTEESTARIGQRVPVRTASYQTGNTTIGGVVSDVINYEQVGLTLKFTPTVFPNQDVQVKMSIESKEVTGAATLTPVFIERSILGTARIQNNKTLLLASVAQEVEARGRTGLPLIGLIPILGRLFTAPTRDNRQVDFVISITPRVIRAPSILPEDEIERPTGSVSVPTGGSLEAMVIQEERDDYLASIRRLPRDSNVQLPDQPATPEYVRTSVPLPAATTPAEQVTAQQPVSTSPQNKLSEALGLRPIDTSARTLQIAETSLKAEPNGTASALPSVVNTPSARLSISEEMPQLKAGQRIKVPVMIDASSKFSSAILGLSFDQSRLAVRSVSHGDVFGPALTGSVASPFVNNGGRMFVSLAMLAGTADAGKGTLAIIEFEALSDGIPVIQFEKDVLNILSADGKGFSVQY